MNASVPKTAHAPRVLSVVLIGNPNTGKTTLFNALTGMRHRVGNYAGVTVETKTARARKGTTPIDVTDVPGTYSLSPRSPDEMLAVELLLGLRDEHAPPDAVVCIVDASNIERNLYLTTQILELGLPVVIALNMIDVAADQGLKIDVGRLSASLQVPVVPIQANAKRGVDELVAAVESVIEQPTQSASPEFPPTFHSAVDRLAAELMNGVAHRVPRYLVERAVLDIGGASEKRLVRQFGSRIEPLLESLRRELNDNQCPIPAIEARVRYRWIGEHVRPAVERPAVRKKTQTDRIDKILLHRFWGLAVFLVLMTIVFQSIYSLADYFMSPIDEGFGALGAWAATHLPEGALRDLIVDGLIAGVGNVIIFLPQIVILFGFLAILEDCGYMARAAFLMDKLMARCGLSGKSFVPLLSSFACAIPGIMSARTIEDRRDRFTTILVAPLMSCSARLPVYVLLIGAFIPARPIAGPFTLQGLVLLAMYLIGLTLAPLVAWALKSSVLRGEQPVFLMELPTYKWPSIETVLWRMADRGWAFVRRAGTLILATTVIIWALQYYPRSPEFAQQFDERIQTLRESKEAAGTDAAVIDEEVAKLDRRRAAEYQENSFLGQAGKLIEPVVKPIGWDWRIGMAVIASFPAREVVVSALGTIYSVGEDEVDAPSDEEGFTRLQSALRAATWPDGRRVFTVPVALSIMVFFALCSQCAATLIIIRRELNSWAWPAFTFVYMTTLAYIAALAVYQIGTRLGSS